MKRSVLAVLSLVMATGCDVLPAEELGTAQQADLGVPPAPDPALSTPLGVCSSNYTDDAGTFGDIRYPQYGDCGNLVYSPLAVVMHGKNFQYDSYDYLLDHLAANGYIVVSINLEASDSGDMATVAAARHFLDHMLTFSSGGPFIDASQLALIGHSQGGATVRHLAEGMKGNGDAWIVRALVGLAAVDGGPINADTTVAYLGLAGSLDSDRIPSTAFDLYDPAGTEQSITYAHPDALYKGLKLIENGVHHGFTDGGAGGQQSVTKGYVLAFLHAHLKYDVTWYDEFIRGDGKPGGYSSTVVSQTSDGFWRLVIDNFEGIAPTIGGSFQPGAATTARVDLGAEPTALNVTHALELSSASKNSLTWSFPATNGSSFKHLAFRLAQASGAAATDIRVRIRNNAVWSTKVLVVDHGAIAQPMAVCITPNLGNCTTAARSNMGSVRIPLDTFGAHDAVDGIRFELSGDALNKTFLLDNIELSEWVNMP